MVLHPDFLYTHVFWGVEHVPGNGYASKQQEHAETENILKMGNFAIKISSNKKGVVGALQNGTYQVLKVPFVL